MKEHRTGNISAKEHKKDSNPDKLLRLKKAWEKLQEQQKYLHPSKAHIDSVKIIKDEYGKQKLQIKMSDGGTFSDDGDKKMLFQAMKKSKRRPNIGRLLALLKAVRNWGYDAVAMGLPPELKRELLVLCKKCNIPLNPSKENKVNISSQMNSSSRFGRNGESESDSFMMQKSDISSLFGTNSFNNRFSDIPEEHHISKKDKNLFLKENSVKNKQITSLSDLDKAAVDLKRAYEKFRDFRTEQCKEEIKKDFFDSLNKQVKEIKASGKPLSPEDKKVLECAKQYGITGDKEGQPLTPNQRKAREELRIENLPKNLQIQFEKRKQYYADIYTAKIAAVDLTCAQIRFDHRKDHHSLNLSVKELDTMIRGHLPPADKMNSETIQKTLQGIKEEHQALQQKQRQAQRNGYEKNMETMTKYMTSENNGKTSKKQKSQQICEHIQRRTFKENVSLKNLAWNQSSRR